MTDIFTTNENENKITAQTSKKAVLIIEDMNEMRLMLRSMMVSLGYTNIDIEASGQSAIKRISNKNFDVILCDFNLGDRINGQQVLETFRNNNLSHSAIFIMITADTGYDNVASVLEYQPDGYMVKPFTPEALHRRLDRINQQKSVFSEINKNRTTLNFEAMVSQAKTIMAKHPQYTNLCSKIIGESLISAKNYKAAKIHYTQAIEHNEKLSWAHLGIAQCNLYLKHPLSAVTSLEKAISLSRHYLPAYDALADAQEELDNLQGAQAAMVSALEVSPQSITRLKRLGQISTQLKDWQMAEQAYSRIIRLIKDTHQERVEYYYEHLTCLTAAMLESEEQSPQTAEKFKRSLMRLRTLGKEDPTVITNSFRIEVQQHLNRERVNDAIKSWKQWQQLIDSGKASPITLEQENTIKRRLGLLKH